MVTPRVPVRRVHTGDRVLDDAQRLAQETARRLNASIFVGATLIDAEPEQTAGTGLSFTAGTTRAIAHGLGRKAVGWLEVYGSELDAVAHVGLRSAAPATGTSSATHVTVTPTSTGKCFLVVF